MRLDLRVATQRGAALLLVVATACTAPGSSEPPPAAQATSTPTATTEPTPTLNPIDTVLAECEDGGPASEPVTLTIGATSSGFDTDRLEGPRHCEPFTVTFENQDSLAPHNFSISLPDNLFAQVYSSEPFDGPRNQVYEIPALPAGEYTFVCTVHLDTMQGTLIVSPP